MKKLLLVFLLIPLFTLAQNMVPNPSFETIVTGGGYVPSNLLTCSVDWNNNTYLTNPAMNSADLNSNGSGFFSSINAYDGTHFASLDFGASNPEYIQVKMLSPMVAGTTYCVSFYTSIFNKWTVSSPFIGAYFSNTQLTVNPYVAGIAASVQATAATDPTVWIQVSETYIAHGGEEYITLGCFQGNIPTLFSYNYIDLVDVHPMNISVDLGPDQLLCAGQQATLNAGTGATSYVWNTGATTASITITAPGEYWVQKYSGACPVTDTIIFSNFGCNDPVPDPDPVVPVIPAEESALFIPNSFSPNGDGINDVFGAKGESISNFELTIFNRWGEKIFYSSDINEGWNGTVRQQQVKEDVYVYTLNYEAGMRKKAMRGHVVLIR